ncbi:MAG: hypothetical protein A2075_16365 [Geobacteraceae bacterium GWC2_58_44]|nr:MAG: hypothetical protein A2075_16365 [Geobacteraceae bacterium GWC2_58_44]HBG05966.1 hypothetical protein [Geobacter sp.]
MFGKQAPSGETICNRIRKEMIPLLYQIGCNDEVIIHNPHIVACWERKGCLKTDCSSYGDMEVPCWYRTGTYYCCETAKGIFVEKCGGCRHCDVFKESCPTLFEELGEALNHLLFSLREEKKTSRKHLQKIEGTEMTMAWILAERVRKTCENEPIEVETKGGFEKTIFQTMSIGLAPYRKGMSAAALLEQADAAVYRAKAEGKNKVNRFGID